MERLLAILPVLPKPWPVRYALTALIMLACCTVQYLIFRTSGFTGLFILLPGIFLSGLLFDRGSAFFGTLIGSLFAVYILFPGFALPSNAMYVPIILFMVTGFFLGAAAEMLRKAMERITAAERDKDLLLRELRHRTKNDIMNITSVLRIQARQATTPDIRDALMGAAGRVDVMGEVQTFSRELTRDRQPWRLFDRSMPAPELPPIAVCGPSTSLSKPTTRM